MAVKIRLQRHGKKGKAFYWIVATDARAKRDGRYLQKLGTYNPNTNPATIDLDLEECVKWIQFGAQPTDTARAILSYKGVLLKNHLLNGVKKGALTEVEAEEKFEAWISEKQSNVDGKKAKLDNEAIDNKNKALELEKEASEKRKLKAEQALIEEEAPDTEEKPAEEAPAEEVPAAEETPAKEVPAAEETPAEEVPAAEEAPAEEAPAEEAPAEEAPVEKEKPAEEEYFLLR